MEIFSLILVTGEFPSQRPMTWSFDVFFYLRLNKRLSKQSSRQRFETPPRSLWCHYNGQRFYAQCCGFQTWWGFMISLFYIKTRWPGNSIVSIGQSLFNILRHEQNGGHFVYIIVTGFSSVIIFLIQLKFQTSLFLRVQLAITQDWFRKWFASKQEMNWQQAVIWTIGDPFHQCVYHVILHYYDVKHTLGESLWLINRFISIFIKSLVTIYGIPWCWLFWVGLGAFTCLK